MVLLQVVLVLVVWLAVYNFYWKRRHLPPGPTPWPILGNMIELFNTKHTPDVMQRWSQRYGGVFTYWQSELPVVAVTDPQLAHRVFVQDGDNFVDRFGFDHVDEHTRGGPLGIIFASGPMWREHRRFALKVLRDFGVGKNRMQENILEEATTVLDKLQPMAESGESFDFAPMTDLAVGSIINNLLFGYRFSTKENECEFELMKKRLHEWMFTRSSLPIQLWYANDLASRLPLMAGPMQRHIRSYQAVFDDMTKNIADHRAYLARESPSEPRDYVDAYLMHQAKLEASGGDAGHFTDLQLRNMVFDMWLAGQETTSTTITWGVAFLIHCPRVQEKAFAEVRRVVGGERLATTADKPDLPYLNAVINEVQRRANLVAVNVVRRATKDYDLNGHKIKAGQPIVAEIAAIMEDPKVFPEPKEFRPERFLDENGHLKRTDELVPFGLGKRACLGEALARMELFLFFTNLINHYKFLPSDKLPVLEKWPRPNCTTMHPYHIRVEKRPSN